MENKARYPHPLIPFSSPEVEFDAVGGKGANLIKLVQAGFAVPDGFIIPTAVYRQYADQNQLDGQANAALEQTDLRAPESLEAASNQIRAAFSKGQVSPEFSKALEEGWQILGEKPVAVRSSATAEDLPDMSFAGQQDTFLNVIGTDALIEAVVKCWSSLWTARAIGYRTRNQIDQGDVALSVIVQIMVQSKVSGVLFTANPLTGLRREVVIDAAYGLGEALVSGQVEPDHYVVDTDTNEIAERYLGSKAVTITGSPRGGVLTEETDRRENQALPDESILRAAAIGKKIEEFYEFPQDIEFAWKDGSLYILQSRPITSLYPVPESQDDGQLKVYFSFGAVQGLLGPMTPLGQDAIRLIFAGGASLFGFDHDHHSQKVLKSAGERLWGDFTPVLRHPIGARMAQKVFPIIEPGSLQTIKTLIADPAVEAGTGKLRFSTFSRLAHFGRRIVRTAIYYARNPEAGAAKVRAEYEAEIVQLTEKYGLHEEGHIPLEEIPILFREIQNSFIFAVPKVIPAALAGLLQMILLNRFSNRLTESGELALQLTRGMPNNVTTEMDLILWETAKAIRADQVSFETMTDAAPETLADDYLSGKLLETAQHEIGKFLDRYGMRGLGEIDIGRPRWRENPAQVIETLQSYLKIDDPDRAPDVVFERGAQEAERALAKLEAAARKTFGGRIKTRIIRASTRRLRSLAGLRESPKFFIIQLMGIIRREMLAAGRRLVEEGKLEQPDDLFYLTLDELDGYALGEVHDWKAIIGQHRQHYARELRRKQIPRLLVSDGRAFYAGMGTTDPDSDQWTGSPVSPGMVEGNVRVVFDPHQANLAPGEILVCPGTDPAWTPLFLAAGGLVMETGGMMTHGAIVAREYGIPAVVGVNQATEFLKTGDRIRVDGSSGLIERLDHNAPPEVDK